MAHHGTLSRQPTPDSLKSKANADPGLFGRMFPSLPAHKTNEADLEALAASMLNTSPIDNQKIPAGFTYLGQFIDHDITLDLTSLSEKASDPEAKENFRSSALDLDSVYGLGPDGSQYLYDRDPATFKTLPTLLVGTAAASSDPGGGPPIPELKGRDLPRSPATGIAIIGDSRNDENLLVAQLHVAFLNFHNKVVERLKAEGVPDTELFTRAREQVVWHYQWIVLHEFLEHLTGEIGIAARILNKGRRFYRFKKWPFMPIEFSVAAYRLGHSMVREDYSHNRIFRPNGGIPATLDLLFRFTAKSGQIVGSLQPPAIPLPQPTLPSNWAIDWRRFFDFKTPAETPKFEFNFAQKLDPLLIEKLHNLPGGGNLAAMNLKRGLQKGLPSGQSIAAAMGVKALTPEQISTGNDGAVAKKLGFTKSTPLWYYILKEAEVVGKGLHLGPVGTNIIAEVFVGIVQGSDGSYLNAKVPFKPKFGAKAGEFTMVDLLTFAGVVNPLGN